jgi:hypothetical protein
MPERFEDANLADASFRNVNLAGAAFDDANLAGASFDNVNLQGGVLRNVNLAGVRIEQASLAGLTIHGFRIDQLIDEELDRRDPQRRCLRMNDPLEPAETMRVLQQLDQLRADFLALLREEPGEHLTLRPGPNRWSAIEHLRHLVFAEELYVHRWILADDEPFSPIGLLPAHMLGWPDFEVVGTEPTQDLERIVSAWYRVHARLRSVLAEMSDDLLARPAAHATAGDRTVGDAVQTLALHDWHHIRRAQQALADAS